MVHVAPASPSLRGEVVLADIDLVINALRVTGTRAVKNQAKNNVTSRVRLDEKYAARRALLKVARQRPQFACVCGIFLQRDARLESSFPVRTLSQATHLPARTQSN